MSMLAAETASLASTLDQLSWFRLFWAWIIRAAVTRRQAEESLSLPDLPDALAVPTIQHESDTIVAGCRSLYDLTTFGFSCKPAPLKNSFKKDSKGVGLTQALSWQTHKPSAWKVIFCGQLLKKASIASRMSLKFSEAVQKPEIALNDYMSNKRTNKL